MVDKSNLQKSRREKIPQLIEKYESLVDNILNKVGEAFPVFKDVHNPDNENEVITSAEQQQYRFVNVRKEAVNNANSMMIQVNELERELNDPEWTPITNEDDDPKKKTPAKSKKSVHPSKQYANS